MTGSHVVSDGRRSSCTTRRSATARRARTSRSRSPTSCGSRACSTSTACPTSRAAGRARTPRTSTSSAGRKGIRWSNAKLAAFGSTRHRANRAEADPNLQELARAETPVVTIFGKSWLLHVIEVLGATPAENLDMIADSVGFIAERGREVVYDAEHFFDGYKADRDYALVDAPGRPRRRRADARPVRHERRHAHRRAARDPRRTRGALDRTGDAGRARRRPHLGHPHPQRRRARGRELPRRRAGGRPPRPGDDQRLRRALRQRQHGQRPGRPRPQDGARAASRPAAASSAA